MAHSATIAVNEQALREVLEALQGPKHLILEMMSTRRLATLGFTSPIDTLIQDLKAAQTCATESAK